jgi:dihydroxy-acid dehydratase
MLMAAARLDIPAIIIVGGPMEGGCNFDHRAADTTSLTEGLGMLQTGQVDEETYRRLEDEATPTCGSCSFLGTANTMCCIAEAMGMSLPGSASIPATHAARNRAAQTTGRRIVEMVHEGLTARQIINQESIENGLRLSTAIGGSTNTALHMPAIAYEAECEMDMDLFERICRTTPHIARMNPAAAANVPDFHAAGGVPAVMKEILPLLHGDARTVTGSTVAEDLEGVRDGDRSIVRSLAEPWSAGGGLAILRGNLAPGTGITKPAAIADTMQTFTGKARCFDGEEAANEAILAGVVQAGEVVVIRYEGPKGGPGMREMYIAMKLLYGRGLALTTALITDGRFSGTNNGCFVGHISPEAAEGGPLAAVEDGDEVTIDIPNRSLQLAVSDDELQQRLDAWERPQPKFRNGYLSLYARLAESADKGAIIRHRM